VSDLQSLMNASAETSSPQLETSAKLALKEVDVGFEALPVSS